MAKSTIFLAIKDLRLKSNTRSKRHLLIDALKAHRLEKGNALLSWLKSHAGKVVIFSDEYVFSVDQVYNSHNDRYLAKTSE